MVTAQHNPKLRPSVCPSENRSDRCANPSLMSLESLSLWRFFFFFFTPLSPLDLHTDASEPEVTVTADSSPFYSCHIIPVSTSPSSLSVRTHRASPSIPLAFRTGPCSQHRPALSNKQQRHHSSNACMELSAWIAHSHPRKSISP